MAVPATTMTTLTHKTSSRFRMMRRVELADVPASKISTPIEMRAYATTAPARRTPVKLLFLSTPKIEITPIAAMPPKR